MSLGNRVKKLINNRFKNLAEAASAIGIDAGSLSRIIRDSQDVSSSRLLKISSYFEVSTDWLLTGQIHDLNRNSGEEQFFYSNKIDEFLVENEHSNQLTPGQASALAKFSKLSPQDQAKVIEYIELLASKKS